MVAMKAPSKIINQIKVWCQDQPVRLCVLFGSQATGRANTYSDIDLAIWPAETLSTTTRLRWVSELEILLETEISLVIVSADLDPVLGIEIYRHGQLVYEREPELWFHHRLQLWHSYNDHLPLIRAARQQLRDFAEGIRHGS